MICQLASLFLFSVASFAQPCWPTQAWRTSTPEEQGLDPNTLAEAVEFVLRENVRAHSLLVIRKTSRSNLLSFARRHLFGRLQISDVSWPTDPRNEDNHGWGDLQLRPHDMAKIGHLFLKNGQWEGRPILSPDWVRAAMQKRVNLRDGENYGYLWWMPAQPRGLVEARGRGGQRIVIWPEKNAVINHFRLELTFADGRFEGKLAETTGLGSIPIRGKLE